MTAASTVTRWWLAAVEAVERRDELAGAGAGEQVVDLATPRPGADADDDQPGLLASEERGVQARPVR